MTILERFSLHRKTDADSLPDRGRPVAVGRGGAGNLHYGSQPVADNTDLATDFHSAHTGRGGMGNVRSPSRDPIERQRIDSEKQHALSEQERLQTQELSEQVHTMGRGGMGNVSQVDEEHRGRTMSHSGLSHVIRSLSRSQSREPRSRERSASARRDASGSQYPLGQVQETEHALE